MFKGNLRRILIIIAIVFAVWFLFIKNGGDTITILNRSNREICEVYFAFAPEQNGWGRNRLLTDLKQLHSRDIRLPIYFEWFADAPEMGYSGRAVDCEGNEILVTEGIGIDSNFFIWEVR